MDFGDIEDLILSPSDYLEQERLQFDHVVARVKKLNGTNKNFVNKKEYRQNLINTQELKKSDREFSDNEDNKFLNNIDSISYAPGVATIFVKTWGCTHNDSDAQYMAGQLQAYGYTITNNEKEAHLWLLNSCTVKSPSEQHFRNYVENGIKNGKKIVVSGCVSQAQPNSNYLSNISIVGVQQIDRVVEVVEETLQGRTVRLLGVKKKENGKNKKKLTSLNLPKIRKNRLIEIISINVGCLNNCTYCKTKHARGELASYTMKEITDRAYQSIKEGVKEIWITSEDTGAYGKDLEPDENGIQPNIANLLKSVLNVLPPDCRLRFGMSNPPYLLEHLTAISKIMQEDNRIYKFLHLPVQSGSNIVLEDMKREYTVEEFQHIVDVMRERVPGITIATDLILGFPTETEEDFEQTVQLVEKNKFPSLFINQFYPRPGTPAAKMDLIPANEVKKRTKKITNIFQSYYPYSNRVGKRYSILVTEVSSDRNFYVGHNDFYEQVLVEKRDEYLGKLIEVEIKSVGKFFMVGRVLNDSDKNLISKLKNLFNFNSNLSIITNLTMASVLIMGLTTIYFFKLKK